MRKWQWLAGVVVALGFLGSDQVPEAHTPNSRGGDSVAWFYSPAGDLAGCPVHDAGPFADGGFPAADAADGGAE